jgi:hypothetical protein
MTTTYDNDTHTRCYRDVTAVPAEVLANVGAFVAREWGESYRMGFVAIDTAGSAPQTFVYVFQVKAPDGSRFAVGCTRWGEPWELQGKAWFAFLQVHEIEAYVRGVRS